MGRAARSPSRRRSNVMANLLCGRGHSEPGEIRVQSREKKIRGEIQVRVTTQLAIPIISRLQSILYHNVNIMDHRGIIVASSDENRMYQYHEAALKVIQQGREVIIEDEDRDAWEGTKPGVNLPLQFQGETVGVVGITGSPAEVYPFARITKMTVETLLEQLSLQQQSQFRRTAILSWLQELIGSHHPDEDRLSVVAHSLRLNVDVPRMGVVIQRLDSQDKIARNAAADEELNATLKKIAHRLHPDTIYATDDFRYLLAVPFKKSAKGKDVSAGGKDRKEGAFLWTNDSAAADFSQSVAETLMRQYPSKSYRIGIGNPQRDLKGYRKSFQQAHQALELQQKLSKDHPYIGDWGIARLLDAVPDAALSEFTSPYATGLSLLSPVERTTLQVFLEQECNSKETAEMLHVHRNTLMYRLQKIQRLTGLNPNRFSEAMHLSLLLTGCQIMHPGAGSACANAQNGQAE